MVGIWEFLEKNDMIVTIKVEHPDRKSNRRLIVEKRLTIEEIDQAKFDIVGFTIRDLRDKIDQCLTSKNEQ